MRLTHVHMKQFEEYKPYIDTLILPIGTIEAHGPHAPLGTDVLIPKRIADYIERQLSGRVWTAPEIAYGHCWSLQDFPGTIDVPQRIFADYVHAVVSSFAKWGLKNVVLLNGHGGNSAALNEVANRLVDEGLHVLVSNYWLDYQDAIREITPGVGHAGEDETSLVMAIDPKTVDLSLTEAHTINTPPRLRYPGIGKAMYPEAYSGDAKAASVEKGERLFECIVTRLVHDITTMWGHNS
jgi:creatinine amidohydrolase